MSDEKFCSTCGKKAQARGLCNRHYVASVRAKNRPQETKNYSRIEGGAHKQTGVYLSATQFDAVKRIADRKNTSVSAVIREAIDALLDLAPERTNP